MKTMDIETKSVVILGIFFITLLTRVNSFTDEVFTIERPDDDQGEINLLNADFEEDLNQFTDWGVVGCDVAYSDDAQSGRRSIVITNRTQRFGGVVQRVYNVTRNTTYYMSAYFKTLENSPTQLYYMIRLWVGFQLVSGDEYESRHFARLPNLRASPRWRHLGGDFTTPDDDLQYLEVYFEVNDMTVAFQMDSARLTRLDPDPFWRERADADIQKYRTNSVTIRADFPDRIPYCKCQIQVDQTRNEFGFGTAVQADRFNEMTRFGDTYRNFHYKNFNWAVFANDMKWKPMERRKGSIRFSRVDAALEKLNANNITTRGHTELWGVQSSNPGWVQVLTGEALQAEVDRRLDYLLTRYSGKIAEWDVINEWLHATFFDVAVNDPFFQDAVYNRSRELDPYGKLYINDYQGLRTGDFTTAFVDQAHELMSRGVPVDGIGIQSHLRVPVPPEILRKRLSVLAAGGFPLTITELSIHNTDETGRAEQLDQALRIYFSNPAVVGLVFWFVSNVTRISFLPEETALFLGEDFQPTPAGQVYLDLRAQWQTHVNITPETPSVSHRFDGYHGNYDVKVFYDGELVKNQSFYLNPGRDITVTLDLQDGDFPDVEPEVGVCGEAPPSDDDRNCGRSFGCRRRHKNHKRTRARAGNPQRGQSVRDWILQ